MANLVDAFLDGYEGPVEEVPVCGKPGLIEAFRIADSELESALARAGLAGAPRELRDRVAALEAQIEASVQVFRLRGLPYGEWADLRTQHPELAEFETAALAACAVEPPVTVAQAQRMRDTLGPEFGRLMAAVARLNQESAAAPKSLLLSALRAQSDGSSDTPPSTESPEAGSLADAGEQ